MNDAAIQAIWKRLEELERKVVKLEAWVSARRVDLARFNKYRLLSP